MPSREVRVLDYQLPAQRDRSLGSISSPDGKVPSMPSGHENPLNYATAAALTHWARLAEIAAAPRGVEAHLKDQG
jgi:hypothetical protein